MIRNSEIEFVQNRISECHGKPGAMWKIIRNYAPTSRASASTVQYTKDIRATADEFNYYFTSVGQKTAETVLNLASEYNIDMSSNTATPVTLVSEQFEFKPITQHDLETCIGKMPANKSPGADKIPMTFFKTVCPTFPLH
jgi:hypothetical protein